MKVKFFHRYEKYNLDLIKYLEKSTYKKIYLKIYANSIILNWHSIHANKIYIDISKFAAVGETNRYINTHVHT